MTVSDERPDAKRTDFLTLDDRRELGANDLADELALIARQVGRAVAPYLRWARTQVKDVEFKANYHDPVTVFDRECERAIAALLGAAIPGSKLVGEEHGLQLLAGGEPAGFDERIDSSVPLAHPDARSLASRVRWIVDPIDGTANFAAGLTYFGTSIAAQLDGEVVAGAIHIPVLGATAWAGATSAWWEEAWSEEAGTLRALDSSGPTAEKDALASVYIPTVADLDSHEEASYDFTARLTRAFRAVRRPGASALDFAHLAAGHFGAVIATGLGPWDSAAGTHLARRAGARVRISTPMKDPAKEWDPHFECGIGRVVMVSAAGMECPTVDATWQAWTGA